MTLADKIHISTRYTRSTNIERDRGSRSIVESYLPTHRGTALLGDCASAFGTVDVPRAWSLVGPYGCGKSSFALFLHELLGENSAKATACRVLAKVEPTLARQFSGQRPWCRVVLTGSDECLVDRLLVALDAAASTFWANKRGRKPAVLDEIRRVRRQGQVSGNGLMELIDNLQVALEKAGAGGLLLVIDELGKFLEYEAHRGGGGVYILQQLAERAFQGRKSNLMLFVLLHQGFDLYARGIGEKLKNDWAKVQGRFQSVSFVETPEQALRVVAAAFSNSLTRVQREAIRDRAVRAAKAIESASGLPPTLGVAAASDIFASCYPMHPVSLLALPVLCQRFAQNERTLFNYLGSREPHGFRDSVESLTRVGDWVSPAELYDYFVQNQPAVLADPLTHRRWAEVVTAVDRAEAIEDSGQASPSSLTALAKVIGVLNLIAGSGGLRAAPDVLKQLFPSPKAFEGAINQLLRTSVVQYRKFADEYRVWQGTDFDIDERTRIEREKLGHFDLATALTDRSETAPIVARRHSVETGTLRYFDVAYVDSRTARRLKSDDSPRVVFFLAEGKGDEVAFVSCRRAAQPSDVCVLHHGSAEIRAALGDVLALEGVERGTQELASDPVASREVKERLQAARISARQAMNALTESPAGSDWYWRDRRLEVPDGRALQHVLSDIMDSVYAKGPVIRSELANRERLSSQAAAARNKLFLHMLNHADRPSLAIEKHPPEKAIYRSLLEAGRLHVEADEGWVLAAPDDQDPLNLRPTWARLDELFEMSESGPVSMKWLMDRAAEPPFGIKRGVFPILLLHYYLLHRHEVAFYDEGIYAPRLTYEHLERAVRRPDLYSFQRFRIEGIRASLFDEYSKALFGEIRDSIDLLSLAKPLTNFVLGLSDHARKTRRIPEVAVKVRQAFFMAKSPERLLLKELPKACGFDPELEVDGFDDVLIGALRELDKAESALLDYMRRALCGSFDLGERTPLSDARELLRGRCHGLERYTVDVGGLRSFVRRICDREQADDDWFRGVLHMLGRKPAPKWTDQDRDAAEYRLAQFAARLLDLEKLRLHDAGRGRDTSRYETVLVKTVSTEGTELDQVVSMTARTDEAIDAARSQIRGILASVEDDELRLALVARLTSDFLAEYHQSKLNDEGGSRAIQRVG